MRDVVNWEAAWSASSSGGGLGWKMHSCKFVECFRMWGRSSKLDNSHESYSLLDRRLGQPVKWWSFVEVEVHSSQVFMQRERYYDPTQLEATSKPHNLKLKDMMSQPGKSQVSCDCSSLFAGPVSCNWRKVPLVSVNNLAVLRLDHSRFRRATGAPL